jgi:16S rRNA (guanine527-N7)-methyltransferase
MMTEAQRGRLIDWGARFGATLARDDVAAFDRIAAMLLEANERVNLTGLKTVDEVVDKHFIDSLAGHRHLGQSDFFLDIGTGGGFPGLPLKLAAPDRRALLIDGTEKKIRYVQEVISALDLRHISALHQRAENKGFQFGLEGQFDAVTARAVAKIPVLAKAATRYLKPGGVLLLYKGVQEAEAAAGKTWPGYGPPEVHFYELPEGDRRALVLLRKE